MSARGLIGETWRLLRSHGRALLFVSLVFLVPAELAVAYAREDSQTVGIAATFLLYLLGYPWVFGALLVTLDNRARAPLQPYGRSVDRLPGLVFVNLVAGIAVLLGLVLLVVPGLLVAARWSAALALVTLEAHGPLQSFEASNAMIRGRTWPVVGALVLVLAASFAVAVPGFLITELGSSPAARGLGEVLLDLAIFLPTSCLSYVIYRRARAT